MKSTRRFLKYKRYLDTYFACIWTRAVFADGTRGPKKKRLVKVEPKWKPLFVNMSRGGMPLRIKEG